jgi:CHAT domain-containing protein/tetratricopeptide (TPR) repeat protein
MRTRFAVWVFIFFQVGLVGGVAGQYILTGDTRSSQGIPPADSVVIRGLIDRAKTIILKDQDQDLAEKTLDSISESLLPYPFGNTELHALYWQAWGGLAFRRFQLKESIGFFEKSLGIFEHCYPPGDVRLATSYHNLGVLSREFERYETAIQYLNKALDIRRKKLLPNDPELAGTVNALGTVYYETQDYASAKACFYEAERIFKMWPKEQVNLAIAYLNLGNISDDLGDYDRAIEYYRLSLALRRATLPALHPRIARCLTLLGNAYQNAFHFPEAEKAFIESINIHENLEDQDSVRLADAYECYSSLLAVTGRLEAAIRYQEKSMAIRYVVDWMPPRMLAIGKGTLAELYFTAGDFNKCLAANEQSLRELEQVFAGQINSYTIEGSALRAAALVRSGKPEEALRVCDTMLARLESNQREVGKYSHFLRQLQAKRAIAQFECYLKQGDKKHLLGSLQDFDAFDSLLVDAGFGFERQSSRLASYNRTRPVFEQAIRARVHGGKFDGNPEIIRRAFYFSEQARAVLLHQATQEVKAKNIAGVPQELLAQENEWNARINTLEETINEAGDNDPDSTSIAKILVLEEKLALLKTRQDSLLQRIEAEYPAYFQLKYELRTESVNALQRDLLYPDMALVEYFVGDSAVYIFTIRQQDYSVLEVKKDFPLEQWVSQLREGMTAFQTGQDMEAKYVSLSNQYVEAASNIYEKLVAPIAAKLPAKVIFIPDGVLGYVPFEALVVEKPDNPTRWPQHHYLLNDHSVSYCYSATMLREMLYRKHQQQPALGFLGFAPAFDGDTTLLDSLFRYDDGMRKDLKPLRYSGEEVYRVAKMLKGQAVVGPAASRTAFTEQAGQARILHLATHGQANDRAGDYCFLVFADQKDSAENEPLLYARDIYNLQLNADLVTLSACETGIGELQGGEGIISLARAFAYAGAKSIVTSLWSVSDAKTKDLMIDFYKNLRKGMLKDDALRQAKLDFLKRNRGQAAHPFYWAGFVGIGNMGKIR